MGKLLCCWQCGSPAGEINYDSVTEYYGMAEQGASIQCSGENKQSCCVTASIYYDTNQDYENGDAEKRVVAAWDAMNER